MKVINKINNTKKFIISVLMIFLVTISIYLVIKVSYSSNDKSSSKLTNIRIASLTGYPGLSLQYLAESLHFYEKNGLKPKINNFEVGKLALDDIFTNKSDFAISAQTPIASNAFVRNDFRIVGSIANTKNISKIVARKDKGIFKKEDLSGKKISTTKGTIMERFLEIFLDKNKIDIKSVEIINNDMKTSMSKLNSGEVDAIVLASESLVLEEKNILNDNCIIFTEPLLHRTYAPISVRKDYLEKNIEEVKKVLESLIEAQKYMNENRDESIKILSKRLNIKETDLSQTLKEFDFEVSLREGLIFSIEDEQRWMIAKGLVNSKESTNIYDILESSVLKKIASSSVDILR